MRRFQSTRSRRAVALTIFAVLVAAPATVEANWLSALTKGAGKAARHGETELGAVGRAANHLHELPSGAKGALAAHATPEGHWQFVNKEGQVFTAGTADELKRAVPTLVPEGLPGEGKLSLYLSEDSVFANRAHLDKLPNDADLHLVTDHGAFPLARGNAGALKLVYRPNVALEIADQRLLHETLGMLSRKLNKSEIRTLAIEPGAGKAMSSAPRLDPATKAPLVDAVDPAQLAQSFGVIRGQTALLVGRVDKGKIFFQPAKGGEVSRDLADVTEAARRNDVNLVLLHADAPRQPGGRNWLWQRIEVGGLDDAVAKSTFGDFFDALGAKRSPMAVSASAEGAGRVRISAVQDEGLRPVAAAENALSELVGNVTGEVASKAMDIYGRDNASQLELDGRIIPGIPTYVQIPYLGGIVAGILGWAVSRRWWARLWPAPARAEGQGRFAYWLRSLPNFLAFLLAFLPLAGGPAFVWHALQQLWATVTAPFRWLAKIFRRRVEV